MIGTGCFYPSTDFFERFIGSEQGSDQVLVPVRRGVITPVERSTSKLSRQVKL